MKSKMFIKISRFFGGIPRKRFKKVAERVNNTPNTEEFEHCIICGALTCIPVSMPIDWRENYEIGCGQICAECAKKQQKLIERGNALTYEQILLAVEQSRKETKK